MKEFKFKNIFVPKYRTYLLIVFMLLLLISVLEVKLIPFSVLIFFLVIIYTYRKNAEMIERVIKSMNSLMLNLKTDDTILDFPIPAIAIKV